MENDLWLIRWNPPVESLESEEKSNLPSHRLGIDETLGVAHNCVSRYT